MGVHLYLEIANKGGIRIVIKCSVANIPKIGNNIHFYLAKEIHQNWCKSLFNVLGVPSLNSHIKLCIKMCFTVDNLYPMKGGGWQTSLEIWPSLPLVWFTKWKTNWIECGVGQLRSNIARNTTWIYYLGLHVNCQISNFNRKLYVYQINLKAHIGIPSNLNFNDMIFH